MAKQTASFTAASTAWSGYTKIEVGEGGRNESRTLRVWCTSTNSTGTATLAVVLRHKTTKAIIGVYTALATATAYRTGADGASGGYVCSVSFAATSSDSLDLLGGCKPDRNDYEWAIGFSADTSSLLASNTTTLYWDHDSEI